MMAAGLKRCQIAAGVLAGGGAKRFGGRPKGLLKVAPGLCILEKQMAALASSGVAEVIILANDPQPYRAFGPNIVPDLRAGTGPLGGIETAVSYYASRFKATLFLPCDLPGITAGQIRILKESFLKARAGVAVAVTEGALREPLCAIVDNELLSAISNAIDEGKRKVGEVWQDLDPVFVHFSDPDPFFNVNTPMDLFCWLTGRGRQNKNRHRKKSWPEEGRDYIYTLEDGLPRRCENGNPALSVWGPATENRWESPQRPIRIEPRKLKSCNS